VRNGGDVKELAGPELDDAAVVEGGCGRAGEDQTDVLDRTPGRADGRTHVLRPAPAWLVGGAPDDDAAEPDEVEAALDERAGLVGGLEALEDDIHLVHDVILSEIAWLFERREHGDLHAGNR
jgi:hypothetical protein